EALLAHELAHIRRHDYLVNILQMVVETLLFYHPAVWWISGRIRHERELCCDDIAVAACGNAVAYARALTQLEKLRAVGPSLAMGSAGGGLYRRVQRLLGCRGEDVPSRLACAIGLVTGVLCLGWVLKTANAEQPSQVPLSVPEGRSVPFSPIPLRLPAPAAPAAPVAREASPAQAIAPIAIELPAAPPAPAPPVSAAPVPPTLTVPALAAPVLPLPPAPISRMSPSAAPVPALPSTAVSPLAIPSVQAPSPSPWVLFRGNDVIVRGNRADEEQARRAHLSFTGDLLWFQVDGKAYTTQDRETLDRIQALGVGTSVQAVRVAGVNVEQLRQQAEALALASDQQRILAQLEVVSAQLQSNLHEVNITNSAQGLLKLRANMAQLEATTAQLQKAMEIEMQKMRAVAEFLQTQTRMEADERLLETLRGVVRSGKAQPTR
ncbi:MAG TPA: M56 family metallopeptidase, partial [Terriglobia bacterium]|nr:M56 family metallopeptidase [Terriglobia bacterium]